VIAGLKNAIEHGYLVEVVDASDRARIKKSYALKMLPNQPLNPAASQPETLPPEPDEPAPTGGVKELNADVKNLDIGVNLLDIGGKESLQRSEQDTLARHLQQDTNSNNNSTARPDDTPDAAADVVASLLQHRVGRRVAQRLAQTYPADYIRTKLEYVDFLLDTRPRELKKPAAWLRKAVEDDYGPPDGFISPAQQEVQAREEKRRKQAVVEAEKRERAQRAAAEKAKAAAVAARRQQLQAQYGTTPDDVALWAAVLTDLSYGQGAIHALVANAEILRVTEERVQLGIPHDFQYRQLQHPGLQTAIRRAFKQHTRRELLLDLVPLAESSPAQ
jgi:hypothetical protein